MAALDQSAPARESTKPWGSCFREIIAASVALTAVGGIAGWAANQVADYFKSDRDEIGRNRTEEPKPRRSLRHGHRHAAAGLAVAACLALGGGAAHADPLTVMSAGAVGEGLKGLVADYTKATGVEVTLVVGNVGMIQDRLKAGENADVVILSAAAIGEMEKSGGLSGDAVNLGRIGIGVAVRADAPKPDVATPAAFKSALLAAKSIAYSDPAGGGSSGVTFDRLIQRLGIADEIRRKAVLIRGGSAADRVASGEAEMAVQNISELLHVRGVQLAGPFPPEYRSDAVYAAGVSARSARSQDAQAFVREITAPAAAAIWRAAGVEPVPGK